MTRITMVAFAMAFVSQFSGQAFAGGLFSPTGLDSASVMPRGIKSIRLGGFSTELADKFDGFGTSVQLGDAFNRPVTWKQLVDATPAGFERGKFKGGLESMGVDFDSVAGDARGMVNTRLTATVPVMAMGLTDKLTVGLAVPIVYSNVSVATGWAANQPFQEKLREAQLRGFDNKVHGYEGQLQNVVATRLAAYGYKPVTDETRTNLGDITLGLKYQLYKDEYMAFAVAPRLVFPTGRIADVDKVVDVASGDGQWDLGVGAVGEYSITPRFTLTASLGYTYQIAATKAKRIPLSSVESISPDVDPSVREKLGDLYSSGVGARFKLDSLWSVGAAYSLQYKPADTYQGSRFGSERYSYLSIDTDQAMQAGIVSVSYSTVPLYLAKKFAAPLDATISFASVFDGHNVARANLTSIDLTGYF